MNGKQKQMVLAAILLTELIAIPTILEIYIGDTVNFGITLFIMLITMLIYWVEFRD
jgi:hypothetical protein